MKPIIIKHPGIILAMIGIIIMVLSLATMSLTMLEKAVVMVICFVAIVFGALSETNFFDKFQDRQEELSKW